ncbi:uncharacterized protein LOC135468218 [Liolophura sinensis]|uniref:uncharacterized protein LOC135468218 n=1 Tax=Liolophura sinensis TaxID=3198878 RepID=UPI003158E68F
MRFMEKDLENVDIVNIKRGIISALQTQINTNTEEEVDSTGKHKIRYSASGSGNETVIIKEYDNKDDVDAPFSGKPGNVHVKGRTTVSHGDITSSEGQASSQPEIGEEEDEDEIPPDVASAIDAGDVLKSESKYKLSLKLKRKRSAQRAKRKASFKPTEFIDTPITIETSRHDQEDELLNRLELLYSRLETTPVDRILAKFLQSKDEGDLDLLKEIVLLETNIGNEKVKTKLRRYNKTPLMDILVPRSYGMLAQCHVTWDICQPMLSLYAQGGGALAEEVFQYLLSADSQLTHEQLSNVIDTVSTMTNPSDDFIKLLIDLYEADSADLEKARSLLLVMGMLAGQDSVSDSVKSILRGILLTQLDDIKEGNCPEDTDHIDALEAAGNMEDEKLLSRVLEIGSVCKTSGSLRIAVTHAARRFVNKQETVGFLIQVLESANCEVVEEAIHLLIDIMANQKSEDNLSQWPLVGVNAFDRS